MSRGPKTVVVPDPSAEEAAALVAAIEQLLHDCAPAVDLVVPRPSAWRRAALAEGVARQPDAPAAAWG